MNSKILTVQAPGVHVTFPLEWANVSLRQFLNLHARLQPDSEGRVTLVSRDALQCLCSDASELAKLGPYEEAQIVNRLTYLTVFPSFTEIERPFELNGHTIPTSLGQGTLLQKWTLDDCIQNRTDEDRPVDYISIAVEILAIYLYPILLNKPLVDADKLDEVIPLVEALPVTIALPLSAFFLSRRSNLTPSGQTVYSQTSLSPRPKRWPLAWWSSWRVTGSFKRFGKWLVGAGSATKKSSNYLTMK